MNQLFIPSRVLRGEAERAALSLYRVKCEIERKYGKDTAGMAWLQKHLNIITLFLDHVDGPLSRANDLEDALNLRGLAQFNSDTVRRKLDVLIPLYEKLMEEEGKPFRRVLVAQPIEGERSA